MSEQSGALRTQFYQTHVAAGAKMIPFAGYLMPVQYPAGIMQEHLHTRAHAGLFDVSHMGQLLVKGAGAAEALERLIPSALQDLPIGQQIYAVLTNEAGGIIDDLIIARWGVDEFFLVVNAACKANDVAHLRAHLTDVAIDVLDDRCLLALQGPRAREALGALSTDAAKLRFMTGCHSTLAGANVYITCSGYTGEDGFEISIAQADADRVLSALMAFDFVHWIGLGARDSLRLEAGLCLYGHDMNAHTSPIEAGLLFAISPARRPQGISSGGFLGADTIFQQMEDGVTRKRVGLIVEAKVPVREGADLVDSSGNSIGTVTSGGFSPMLKMPIAMAYLATEYASVGHELKAVVRGKQYPVRVSRMPFVQQRYWRG